MRPSARNPILWLIDRIGTLVPKHLRTEWRQEWQAELQWRESQLAQWDRLNSRNKLRLLSHACGSLLDALWLQPRRWEDELIQDLRFGTRVLIRQPRFTFAVFLVLAVGIGATTTVFSVVNAVLLQPLPYPKPDQLLRVFASENDKGQFESAAPVYAPDYLYWRQQCHTCSEVGAYSATWPSNLSGGIEPERVRVGRVTASLFTALGVAPLLGRTFLPDETGRSALSNESSEGSTAVVLGHAFWQRRFGANPSIVGSTIKVEGDLCTIVGVMPPGFVFPDDAEAWVPTAISPKRDNAYLRVVARLREGATAAQAKAEFAAIAGRLALQFPDTNRHVGVSVIPLQSFVVGDIRRPLLIFFGAVGFVLLIACANVANLLLARAMTRQREMSVRAALGASRVRIVRQLLTEGLLISFVAAGFGLLFALAFLDVFLAFAPATVPRLQTIAIDPWALAFTSSIAVVTGLAFGIAPALHLTRLDISAAIKGGSAFVSPSRWRLSLSSLLVVLEVALTLILLIGSGLLLKSFVELRSAKLGFNADHVLTASVTLPEASYSSMADIKSYYERALVRLRARPETRVAGLVSALPLAKTGAGIRGDLTVQGEASTRRGVSASKLAISDDYFRALEIPLIQGRAFDEHDNQGSPGVLIISEGLARSLWPHESPIGKRLNIGFRNETWREVVGVVGDLRQRELGAPPFPALYQPFQQVLDGRRWMLSEMSFVLRTSIPPERFAGTVRDELKAVDQEVPAHNVAALSQIIARQTADPRFYLFLLGAFAVVAVILATAGIYSLIAYSVTQRTHEIGIRLALGAQRGDVLRLVMREGMSLVLAGLAIGMIGARVLTRLLESFLYEVSATDPFTFIYLSGMLTVAACVACYLPARRAMSTDPLLALHHE
jgi:putative ABC transport system permease protein